MNSLITFTYNGMLKTNEIAGEGNSFQTEFRQYDSRLGKWLSLDPLMEQFPWMSPFVGFDNNPILYVDPYGLSSQDGRKGQEEDDKKKEEEPKEEKKRSPDGITEGGEFPTNPNLGDIHGDDNNKFYKFKNDGWEEIQSAKVDNSKSKEKKNDSYKGFKGVSLGGFAEGFGSQLSDFDVTFKLSQKTQRRHEAYKQLFLLNVTITSAPLTMGQGGVLSNIILGSSTNLLGQAASVNNASEIDYFDVAVSGATAGIFKNPWTGNVVGSLLEATIDVDGKGMTTVFTDKSINKFLNDAKWGLVGGTISNRNSAIWEGSSRILKPINFGVESGAEFLNNKTNESIK